MELWIRSQDKECLMKVDRLDYDLSNYEHRIMANGYSVLVAKYTTKKRCLEVLDEISYLMIPVKETFDENGESEGINYFANKNYMYYEMPKD